MSLSGLGIALSITFGSLILALVAELSYLLWWKKRTSHSEETDHHEIEVKGMLYGKCCKTQTITNPVTVRIEDSGSKSQEFKDLEIGNLNDVGLKAFAEEESVESELMRLHNLAGPPRFLFTIKEETKEDLESEDCKSKGGDSRSRKGSRTRSLSDLMVAIDTPFLNPLASSQLKSSLDNNLNFNPLFESSSLESELNQFRSSSPPPKFKFLRDAEEKLYRRLVEEAQRKALMNDNYFGSVLESETKVKENKDRTLLRFINNKEREQVEIQQNLPQFPSSSSQVLPLASSPTTFRTIQKGSMVH